MSETPTKVPTVNMTHTRICNTINTCINNVFVGTFITSTLVPSLTKEEKSAKAQELQAHFKRKW